MTIKSINGCIGFEECVKTCPCDVIRMDPHTRKAVITYPADCQICHLCRMYCPVDAIEMSPASLGRWHAAPVAKGVLST